MPGSNLAAYSREPLDVDEVVGYFSIPKQAFSNEILATEDSKNLDYAYEMEDRNTQQIYTVNPYFAASCHTRYIDEALSEADENCRFDIEKGRIAVLATKPMAPGVLLQGRYGQDYWLKRIDHNPYELSEKLFQKYSSTMKELELKDWRRALKRKAQKTTRSEPEEVC